MDPKALVNRNMDMLWTGQSIACSYMVMVNVHKTLHASWRLGKSVFQARDASEDLGKTYQDIPRSLHSNVDIIGTIIRWIIVSGTPNVDLMLNDGCESHRQGGQGESNCNAGDGVHGEPHLPHEWIEEFVQQRDEYDDDDWVNVLHFVVGHTVQLHGTGLADEVGAQLVVAMGMEIRQHDDTSKTTDYGKGKRDDIHDPVDWIKQEHFASNKRPPQFVDEGVIPRRAVSLTLRGLI